MTKTYDVEIPIAGEIYVRVKVPKDADEDAIWEAAENQYSEDEKNGEAQIEWEFYKKIADGNV
jgi:DNA-directed RNA polymerase subunit L